MGVEHVALDPWLTPKPKASSEEAISALQELHQYQAPQLQSFQSETQAVASEECSEETQGRSNALAVTESRTVPEYELSEEERRANIAMLSALCRGEKFEFGKVQRAISPESPPYQGEDQLGDIGW